MKCLVFSLLLLVSLGQISLAEANKHILIIAADNEYRSIETLPKFAEEILVPLGYSYSVASASDNDPNRLIGLEKISSADLIILAVRRRTLPDHQLQQIRNYLDSGRPLVGIRVASHPFHLRKQKPASGYSEWPTFDPDVLGGNYQGHYPNDATATISFNLAQANHPILNGITHQDFDVFGSLYQTKPLKDGTTLLLTGTVIGQDAEPVAWTHHYRKSKIFYTSLGHPKDYELKPFLKLLTNATIWACPIN